MFAKTLCVCEHFVCVLVLQKSGATLRATAASADAPCCVERTATDDADATVAAATTAAATDTARTHAGG
jgi:hypothetical protein